MLQNVNGCAMFLPSSGIKIFDLFDAPVLYIE